MRCINLARQSLSCVSSESPMLRAPWKNGSGLSMQTGYLGKMYFSSSALQQTAVLQIFGYVAGKPSRHMDVLGNDFYRYRITVPGSLRKEDDGDVEVDKITQYPLRNDSDYFTVFSHLPSQHCKVTKLACGDLIQIIASLKSQRQASLSSTYNGLHNYLIQQRSIVIWRQGPTKQKIKRSRRGKQ